MRKSVSSMLLFAVLVLFLICHIAWTDEKTQNINEMESYSVDDDIKELIQIDVQESMPKAVDIIVDESKIVVLCEDGSVWRLEKGKGKNTANKIQNLNNVKKIIYAGSAIYALSEDGYVYAWGSNKWLQIDARIDEDKVFAGAGNYHYFIREDGSIFSIMGTSFWNSEHIEDYIFPVFPIENESFQIVDTPLDISEVYYVDLWEGTKYGFTILYELGQEKSIKCMDADKYTVFLSDREGGLWYWNSKMIKFHDCKDAIADPERYRGDYAGNWKSVNIKEILGREDEMGYAPYIVKICAGSENIFFLTNDGQVFMSEYITNAVEDVDYYNNTSTNPNRERILTATDLNLKTITFRKMDWEDIISINTDGTHFFSAVDKDGGYFFIDTENLD